MIGMLICGLLRGPRPAGAPAEPPPTATAAAVQPAAADDQAAASPTAAAAAAAVTPQPSAETGDSPQPTGR